ncbi:arylesterase [Vibrio porteresiae]|uniref:Arylesterase n=1 Tax=Vibrio porteresiae DSM 19223 TaxID=1123496 RepID=A0ABZ0QGB8_9VIBR|nr:arylesterase [Vibrio porteresiae]WPC75536.1 arylesterase [Vibrio porteresiae DSM 19223]
MIRRLSLLLLLLCSTSATSQTLMILGDSLSAGYQMPIEQAWASLLSHELSEKGKNVTVVNASISGDTSGNGLARLPGLLTKHHPDVVLVELGANDGLRGFPTPLITNNLRQIVQQIQASNAKALVMQIRMPPNYGKRYTTMFYEVFAKVSEAEKVPLIPFYLEQIITKPEWIMADGLHPKPEAQAWIANYMANELLPYL